MIGPKPFSEPKILSSAPHYGGGLVNDVSRVWIKSSDMSTVVCNPLRIAPSLENRKSWMLPCDGSKRSPTHIFDRSPRKQQQQQRTWSRRLEGPRTSSSFIRERRALVGYHTSNAQNNANRSDMLSDNSTSDSFVHEWSSIMQRKTMCTVWSQKNDTRQSVPSVCRWFLKSLEIVYDCLTKREKDSDRTTSRTRPSQLLYGYGTIPYWWNANPSMLEADSQKITKTPSTTFTTIVNAKATRYFGTIFQRTLIHPEAVK